jgi:hypothetical protein
MVAIPPHFVIEAGAIIDTQVRIEQLRRDAEQKLGPAFDLRRFHHVILAEGALPMDLLQQQVEARLKDLEPLGGRRPPRPPGDCYDSV